ncbi:MAG: tetratricopeptide repeat protein [Limisphaerales bacterium]
MTQLVLMLIFACCVTLATQLAPVFESLQARGGRSGNPLLALVGDSRRLFANQFFVMADVYFHSGYYPTIFDAQEKEGPSHLDVTEQEGGDTAKSGRKMVEDDEPFMGTPRDWIERFGRNFFPTVHTHLQGVSAREILPWLKLSADMDPTRIDTYVTASYWLRTRLDKPREAEEFLREGLRANPDSYELLLELGRVYFYDEKNSRVARNIWELALDKWRRQLSAGQNPDLRSQEEVLGELVRDDEQSGDLKQLLADLEELDKATPRNAVIEKEIQDVKAKLAH